MGDSDATIAAAGYRDTDDITQEHAPQKKRDGSHLSRDQNKKKNTWQQRKKKVGWVPVKPGPKQKEREHMRIEKEGVGWVPVKPGLKQYKQGTHEKQLIRDFDKTIAAAGYRVTNITQENAPQKKRDGSQLSRDQNNKRERERENTWEHRKQRVGRVPVQPGPKRKEREHMRAEKEGGGWIQVKPGLKHCKQGTHEMQ